MSSSRPVPEYRFPKRAVVYQSVSQPAPGRLLIASRARCGSSPPPGPKAETLTGVSRRAGAAAAGDGAVLAGDDAAGLAFRAGFGPPGVASWSVTACLLAADGATGVCRGLDRKR